MCHCIKCNNTLAQRVKSAVMNNVLKIVALFSLSCYKKVEKLNGQWFYSDCYIFFGNLKMYQ